ncbi:hypothetical protein GIY56_02035 [Paracoccus sp. YIM 132242]|uniref:Uncharacterized protein n=1 Tax=Paracoccus lichenicola TaxID=2665644 RepID=A0A6L6HLM8_9RHOB|nr:hypothetical protein [Paracoccus lichenicola]MTD99062.1 hypothetical protein [Paracoccus lichenicola]
MMPDDILRQFGIDPASLEPQGDYSWAFDPWLETDNPGIQAIARNLAAPAMQLWTGSRQRIRKDVQSNVASCLQVILLNLVRAAKHDARLSVGIGTGHDALNSAARYRPEFMTERAFTDARDKLLETGTIIETAAAFNHAGGSQVARYRLTETALLELTPHPKREEAERAGEFRVSDARETVRLKDKGTANRRARLCPYKDTAKMQRMRDNLARINAVLSIAHITTVQAISIDGDYDPDRPDDYSLIEQGQTLYRVFNYGSFDLGGRFYGGWWQYVRKRIRPGILINGHRTIEADYSGLHPAILFAERKIDIPADPYSAVTDLSNGKDRDWRKAVKRTFNAMLNADRGTQEPRDFDLSPYGISKPEFQQMIRDAFPDLQDAFGSGTGRRLQRIDSDLMEAILLHFADQGIPALPIHDSVIIQEDRRDELLDVMQAVFRQRYGQTPPVRVE